MVPWLDFKVHRDEFLGMKVMAMLQGFVDQTRLYGLLGILLILFAPAFALAYGTLEAVEQEVMALVEEAQPAVVEVTAVKLARISSWSFNVPLHAQETKSFQSTTYTYRQRHVGSGWIYDSRGHIITTAGIVEGAGRIIVRFLDGTAFEATLVGKDRPTNIAVIQINTQKLAKIPIGDSANLRSGSWIVMIGRSYGQTPSLSFGIASGIERVPGLPLSPFIKFNAPIHPGNTGGIVLNSAGEIIGMVIAALATPSAVSSGSARLSQQVSEAPEVGRQPSQHAGLWPQEVGFALPIHIIQPIVKKLIQDGRIVRGWLGVQVPVVEPASFGVTISQVSPDSPAQKAKLQPGDRVLAVNGSTISDGSEFQRLVLNSPPGRKLHLDIQRGKEQLTLTVELGELSD